MTNQKSKNNLERRKRCYSENDVDKEMYFPKTVSQVQLDYNIYHNLLRDCHLSNNDYQLKSVYKFYIWETSVMSSASAILRKFWDCVDDINNNIYYAKRVINGFNYIDTEHKVELLILCCCENSSLIEQYILHLNNIYSINEDDFYDPYGYSYEEREKMHNYGIIG